MFKRFKLGDYLILSATVVYILALFLPWVEVSFLGSISGWEHRGYIVLILFAFPIYAVLANKSPRFFSISTSISAVVFLIFYIMEVTQRYMGEAVSTAAFGLYLALAASIVLLAGVLIKMKKRVGSAADESDESAK